MSILLYNTENYDTTEITEIYELFDCENILMKNDKLIFEIKLKSLLKMKINKLLLNDKIELKNVKIIINNTITLNNNECFNNIIETGINTVVYITIENYNINNLSLDNIHLKYTKFGKKQRSDSLPN